MNVAATHLFLILPRQLTVNHIRIVITIINFVSCIIAKQLGSEATNRAAMSFLYVCMCMYVCML